MWKRLAEEECEELNKATELLFVLENDILSVIGLESNLKTYVMNVVC